jgi:glycosyltransferase involved in cell wall biosynthesis
MRLVHLTSSTFFGGPERQMLGLAESLRGRAETSFLSFGEHGKCAAFLAEVRRQGFAGQQVPHDTPHFLAALHDIEHSLRQTRPDVLLCHGYKADLIGRRAAQHVGVPVIAISRGWTAETWRVRFYEALDRHDLPMALHVVAVSAAQADLVKAAGVPANHITVIHNAARLNAFPPPSAEGRVKLASIASSPGEFLVVTAARLSPEKGVHVLIDAARRIVDVMPGVRFIVFGEGPERDRLEWIIEENGLCDSFALPGFRADLDELIPNADLAVLPSFTEGMPNMVLEASAAGVPVVATAVGGTPECIIHEKTGLLIPAGQPDPLVTSITSLLRDPAKRQRIGDAGRDFVRDEFSFARQANAYLQLFARLGIGVSTSGLRAA